VELSEQATQELAEGSVAIGRVVEAQGRRLETEKVEAEKALCKEKRGKESNGCPLSPFCIICL
jgi:hypothetical protein